MPALKTVSQAITVGDFVELDAGTDVTTSSRYNKDIAPTRASQRTWNHWHIAALWIGMSICVPTYTLGGVLTAYFGLSVVEALWTVLIANVVILIPLTLNAFPGTKYGIPFPVFARAAYGTLGSNVPALMRALVACGWFGIQTWIGGLALHTLMTAAWSGWTSVPGAVWMTETGGMVKFGNGPQFAYSEVRAANRTRWMFRLANRYDTRRSGMRSTGGSGRGRGGMLISIAVGAAGTAAGETGASATCTASEAEPGRGTCVPGMRPLPTTTRGDRNAVTG